MAGGPNCLLGICCPPGSVEAKQALADEIIADLGSSLSRDQQDAVPIIAAWVLDNYDLMPHGSTSQFKEEITTLARENP